VWRSSRPRQELLVRRSVACGIALIHAVGSHGAPFIVIALKPDLKQVGELAVGRNVRGRNMAVVIENRLGFGPIVEEMARGLGGQQKIVVDECHE